MANRPRLPNVDPEDLAKLADQYPGSRTSGESDGSASGTTTSGATGSGASLSAGASSRSGASARSSAPSSSPPPKKRGSWSAAFLTFLFALVALVAAVASIGAPSYRGEIHALLNKYAKPPLRGDTIDILSGYDTRRLEVTYDGLDQRIAQLNDALERVAATEGVSGDDARALMFRDDLAEKLDALTATVAAISDTSEAQAGKIAVLGADLNGSVEAIRSEMQAALADIADSLSAIREDVAATRTELTTVATRMGDAEAGAAEQGTLNTAMAERFDAVEARLGTLTGDFNGLLDLSDQVAQTVTTFKTENMPILAVIQLRDAVNRSEPFGPELAFAKRVLNGAPGIANALDKLSSSSADGIASVAEMRRDLRLIANNLGSFVTKIESWSDRVGGWYNMLVGAATVPEARRGGGLVAAVATMDEALDREDLELVIREGAALQSEIRSPALADWLNAVVERIEVTDAVRKLEGVVYARATGASKAQ
ncbi:MAG: hypothetical protein P1U88_06170 [Thalassobaculaceae bacterium]|nr:hypothetical protein [Thalassobaculaceae bacterium]